MYPFSHLHIAYGSESGRSKQLARQLTQQPFLATIPHTFSSLNETDLSALTPQSLLLVITSSFGDGEAPANAIDFADVLAKQPACDFHYAIFGLGDTSYEQFCGYSKQLDSLLREKSARPLIARVDADLNYQAIFSQWLLLLEQTLNQPVGSTVEHSLSVKVYDEKISYAAQVLEIKHLADSEPPVYHLRLSLEGSGIFYQAGDLIYVQAPTDSGLLEQLNEWFNDPSAAEILQYKELRLLTKNVLRDVAKMGDNAELKALTKISNKKALEAYLYGHDVLDLLQDFDSQKQISLSDLSEILPNIAPRAYSISSCGKSHPDYVDLCVREVSYQLGERQYRGTASGYLAERQASDFIQIFAKSNPTFRLCEQPAPIVMIGAGTGIAPYIGFLQAIEHEQRRSKHYLFFGERYREKDFLYQSELVDFLERGILTGLFTAFSRDQAEKYYVQDALKEQAELIWQLMVQGAYFYVCGSKAMSRAIDESLITIAKKVGGQPYVDEFNNIVAQLVAEGRLQRDVY